MRSLSVDSSVMQKARIGYAPYTAGYGSLHTWLMFELHNMPEYKDSLISNFVIRLFKSTADKIFKTFRPIYKNFYNKQIKM